MTNGELLPNFYYKFIKNDNVNPETSFEAKVVKVTKNTLIVACYNDGKNPSDEDSIERSIPISRILSAVPISVELSDITID